MGVRIKPNIEYFAQVVNIGIEGKIAGKEENKLVMTNSREYDLRNAVGFGYKATQRYNFTQREIPIESIRIFREK